MKPELQRGIQLFNAGEWWEAHEAWEPSWLKATGEERDFIQALILLAAALHKRWMHGSPNHRNFYKAVKYLETLPPIYEGVNLQQLRTDVWRALQEEKMRPQIQ